MNARDRAAKWVLVASAVGGVSYLAADSLHLPLGPNLAWKGTGVGLLALYAALKSRSVDGWLICAVMALGALGDVLLGALGQTGGAAAFLVGHLTAVVLYLRNRRPALTRSQALLAGLIAPAVVTAAFLLPADRATAPVVAIYATSLALMAATAWASRFPRYWTGLGAMMFVVSDLLIFARAARFEHSLLAGLTVWGLYYGGQLLICLGVTAALDRGRQATFA